MSKAAAHAALNDRVKSSLQQTLSNERAEREQAESAANKVQWVEAQRAAERIASVEAKARQRENFIEQIATAKVQSAFDEVNLQAWAWRQSEHAQQQMTVQQMQDTILSVESRCFDQEQNALQQVRLEADQMHNERVRQLSLEATIRIQAQDVQLHSLRDVVAKLENERACRAADQRLCQS